MKRPARLLNKSPSRKRVPSNPSPKVVLAYSGGLDTSVILHWLMETYGFQIIAFCAALGQGEDLPAIKRKARDVGAFKVEGEGYDQKEAEGLIRSNTLQLVVRRTRLRTG